MEILTSAIAFKQVSKTYQGNIVLSNLSFEIAPNETVGLLGKSGMGKTTILKLIAGLEAPDAGQVIVNGRRIGYVFQEFRLLPWKTALENVWLPLNAMGMPKKQARKKAAQLLALMELAEFADYYPAKLSGGMNQRVALARAFAVEPEILLMDEPFSSLDIKLKKEFARMLNQRLKARPATLVYVSHSPAELEQVCSKILTLTSADELIE